jgi:hypothetical protein
MAANDPAGRGLEAEVQKIIGLTPSPNNFSVGDGLNTAGYSWTPIQREKQKDFVVKIDHVINQSHSVYGRYAFGNQNTIGDFVNDGWSRFPGTPRIVDTFRDPKNLALNWRWNPTPRLTNEFVWGFNRFAFSFNNPDPNARQNPPYTFSNFTDPIARSPEVYNARRLATYQWVDNLSYISGGHSIKGGINFRYQQHLDTRSSVAGLSTEPSVNFSTTRNPVDLVSFRIPTDINTSSDRPRLLTAINELLGRVGSFSQAFVAESPSQYAPAGTMFLFDARYGEYDFFIQDTYKLRPNVTVDIGLRWEVKASPRGPEGQVLRPEEPFVVGSAPSNTLAWKEGALFNDDWNNLGPSIGVAWDPFGSGKTAVRANYRVAYDRMNTFVVSSTIFQSAPGLTLPIINTEFGQRGGRIRDGLPALAPPAGLTPEQLRQPASFSTASIHVIDPDWRAPKTHQWGLSLQREIGWSTVLELNYIGRKGVDLFGAYNVNQAEIVNNGFLEGFKTIKAGGQSLLINQLLQSDPSRRSTETGSDMVRRLFSTTLSLNSVGALAAALATRTSGGRPLTEVSGLGPFYIFPFPQFAGGLNILDSGDWSTYHGLEISAQRRFAAGLGFQFGYTWSKSLDTRSFDPAFTRVSTGALQSASSTPFDIRNRKLNYARSDFDRTHAFQGGAVYDLPFGKGRTWGEDLHPVLERIVGGWSVTGSIVLQSGRPFTVYSGSNTFSNVVNSTANCDGCTPDMVRRQFDRTSGTEFYFNSGQIGTAFNTATNTRGMFSIPEPGKLGTLPRNFFNPPRLFNLDLALGKRTRITETQQIEYRLEMQNATNTASFGLPNSAIITSSLFGRSRGNTVSSARKIQMALKYYF